MSRSVHSIRDDDDDTDSDADLERLEAESHKGGDFDDLTRHIVNEKSRL